jgi:LacI family transcriptional regulator
MLQITGWKALDAFGEGNEHYLKKSTTVKDVAAMADVSATTVSYVLNNNPNQTISSETRARVLEAARKLNYVPNNAARILKNSESKCISVVIGKTLSLERFALTLQGIRSYMSESGYNILLCSPDKTSGVYADYIESYFSHYLDGLIYMGRDNVGPKPEEMETIKKNKIPAVIFDCKITADDYATIDFDYYGGAYELTKRLMAEGVKRVLYLRPQAENPQERERESGLLAALRMDPEVKPSICKFPVTTALLTKLDHGSDQFIESLEKEIDAFFNDSLLPIIQSFGKQDVIISSWGRYVYQLEQLLQKNHIRAMLATMSEPPMLGNNRIAWKYCKMDHYQAGRRCAQLLLQQLGSRDANYLWERHVVLPVKILG